MPLSPAAGPLATTTFRSVRQLRVVRRLRPVRFLDLLARSRPAESLSPLASPPPTAPPVSPMTKAYASDDG
jgi:hypothetical protein